MNIAQTIIIKPGRYVVAVSGGVDSMVLLDILQTLPGVKLTVAHYDHGIRDDSFKDRQLVAKAARAYNLPFVYDEGKLGSDTNEETARNRRYAFLRKVQKQVGADAIITAHHMNDAVETAAFNVLRGTGRKGMSSLKSVDGIIRPLLHLPKSKLMEHACAGGIEWLEDSSNNDMRFRRNYIRHQLLPELRKRSPEDYKKLVSLVKRQASLNAAIDTRLHALLHTQPSNNTIRRNDVAVLPHNVGRELVGEWLRRNGKRNFTRQLLERVAVAIKTARPGTTLVLDKLFRITFDKKLATIHKGAQ